MPPPDVSIIIPCYNGAATLPAQLQALQQQVGAQPFEVIVADNGSTDHTAAVVRRFQTSVPVRRVDASAKRGAAYARNAAARSTQAPYLLFCDADDVAGKDWVASMHAALRSGASFVAGALDFERLNPSWVIGDRAQTQRNSLQGKQPFVFAASSNMGITRAAFDAVHGFQEALQALEDVDFCWRLQQHGIPLTFVPGATMHMRCRTTLWSTFQQAHRYAKHYKQLRVQYGIEDAARQPAYRDKFRKSVRWYARKLLKEVRSRAALHRWMWRVGWSMGTVRGLRAIQRRGATG
ncbi:glycosyltransferase [Salisaeta longa]|uniref:glycosyltransferase n=1 Tax=Salisaeta longa TaxID=503170 RepID=UPI00146E9918|nr:glycosyltransferase [Salisaeta longa]